MKQMGKSHKKETLQLKQCRRPPIQTSTRQEPRPPSSTVNKFPCHHNALTTRICSANRLSGRHKAQLPPCLRGEFGLKEPATSPTQPAPPAPSSRKPHTVPEPKIVQNPALPRPHPG